MADILQATFSKYFFYVRNLFYFDQIYFEISSEEFN